MKCLIGIMIFGLLQSTAFAANGHFATPGKAAAHTPAGKLEMKFRHELAQIQMETRKGKLTLAQSKSLQAQVAAIRKQESADMKQNGNKTLTETQIAQLDKQLDGLSKSIPLK